MPAEASRRVTRTPVGVGSAQAASLFTARFFVMCGFSFTVFLSAFMLLPTAPFHILDLGGSQSAAGLFLGLLTYASAFSAPVTGALADRVGQRRLLLVASLALLTLALLYAVIPAYQLTLALVLVHGVFWSGLLSASAAYMTGLVPESRRTEGIAYWGIASLLAIAVAPPAALALYRAAGWLGVCCAAALLNLGMALIAWQLPESTVAVASTEQGLLSRGWLEWRVLVASLTLFLCSFGYGGLTSFVALYAEASGVEPRGLYFTVFAGVMIVSRPLLGRFADRVGHRRVFLPSLGLVALGLGLLALGGTRAGFVASALVFGAGFGSLYPVFFSYVMRFVAPNRHGAAFGAILAAFDTGIGTGSIVTGFLAERLGFPSAFGAAALLAALAIPYFLLTERWLFGRLRPA